MWFSRSEKQSSKESSFWEVRECTFYEQTGKILKTDTRISAERARSPFFCFRKSRARKNAEQKNTSFTVQNGPFMPRPSLSRFRRFRTCRFFSSRSKKTKICHQKKQKKIVSGNDSEHENGENLLTLKHWKLLCQMDTRGGSRKENNKKHTSTRLFL